MEDIRINGYDLLKLQNIADLNARIAAAMIELESMKALNAQRERNGLAQAYDGDMIASLVDKHSLGINDVIAGLSAGM